MARQALKCNKLFSLLFDVYADTDNNETVLKIAPKYKKLSINIWNLFGKLIYVFINITELSVIKTQITFSDYAKEYVLARFIEKDTKELIDPWTIEFSNN